RASARYCATSASNAPPRAWSRPGAACGSARKRRTSSDGAELPQQRLPSRVIRDAALDHLRPELHVGRLPRAGLEADDRVAGAVDQIATRHGLAALAPEPPAAELRESGREVADVPRLVLLDVADQRAGLVGSLTTPPAGAYKAAFGGR